MSNQDRINVQKVFNGLVGEECKDFLYSSGWGVLVYIGKIVVENPLKTFWRLSIECPWRVENNNKIIVGSDDDDERIVANLKVLQGLKIVKIMYYDVSKDFVLFFDRNVTLKCFANASDVDQWSLRRTDGYRLTLQENFVLSEHWEAED